MEAFVVKENCLASASPPLKKRRIDNHTGTEAKADGSAILAFNSNIGSDERQLNVAAFGNNSNNHEIDDHLHSRQLPVYGRETISRRFPSNVLISGMQDLGVEIAKNIILAGVKSVTLHDENVVELWDLSSNFVFSEEDIGKNRALASVQKLQELNNAVAVSTLTDKLTNEKLSAFHAVVFVDISSEKATQFDDYCHSHQPPIAFIKADVMGLFGSLFCDFGPQFTVLDLDGEEPHSGIIASVSNENPAFVLCVDDERLEFEDGDLVVFSEVERVAELNDGKPRKINSVKPYSIFLEEDTTSYGAYKKDGVVTQVKQPKVLNYNREAIKDPGDFLLSDFSKFDWPPLLRLAFQALDRFSSQAGRFPFAGSEEDAQKLVDIAVDINESLGDARLGDVNSKLLGHLAFVSMAVLNPMAAMFGGIVGQEVVKACSGNLALMGVSCGVQGRLTVTDDDVIDKSNLSRQFLFRDWNIGQAKSTVAATGGKKGEESSLGKKLASESTSGKADGIASSSDKDGNSSASYTGGFEKEGSAQFDQEDDDSWSKPSWKKKTHRKVESKEGDEYKIKVHIDLPTVGFVKGFDVCENLCNSIISTVKKIKQQDGKFFVSEINVHGLRHMEKYAKTTFSRLSAKYRFYAERYFYCGNCKEEETVVEGEEKPPLLEMGMMNEIYKEAIDLQDEEYKSLLLVISGDPYFSRAVKKFSKVKRGIEGCVLIQIPVGMFALDMYKPRPRPNLQRAIVKIYVTEPLGGGRFYAQLVEDPRMVEIRNQLAAFTSLNAPLDRSFKPKRGEIVLAQFSVDKFWYRAKIVSAPQAAVQSPDGQFKVFYIDYGNQETVPYSAIRRLDRSLTSAPGCAKLCRLAYIKVSLSYESEALEYLDNITSQGVKVCEATIEGKFKSGEWRGQGTGPGFSVTIKVVGEDISINAALLEKNCDIGETG